MHRTLLAALALVLIPGCPADTGPSDDGAGTAGSSSTTGGGDDSGTNGGSGLIDTGSAESTGTAPTAVPAHGIAIDLIEANQGVAVDLAHGGVWLGPMERQAPLIANRITLVRALWNIGGNWDPREIEGRLILQYEDGTEETLSQTKMVEGDAFIGDLSRAFFWGIMADQMQPGLKFRIELYEVDDALADEPLGAKVPTFPEGDGFEYVGVENSYQVMKVVVVPFNYDFGGCTTSADISEETMQHFSDLMYMQNPLDRLDFEVHEPLDFDGEATNFGQLHSILVDLRFAENALPETYYYGLIDVCSGGLGDAGGQANGIPDDPVNPDNAYQRVSAGLSLDPDWSAETIVHEVGHSQGRRHVFCNGEEGGPDPTYPWEGGVVNEWGFGVIDFQLRHPTVNKDYMTYCHPTWVGNWGWNKVYPVIKGLSTWDADYPGNGGVAPSDPYSGSLLFGLVLPDGTEHWKTIPGGLAPEHLSKDTQIDMELADGSRVRLDAHVEQQPDGDHGAIQIVAPLPDKDMDFAQVRTLARITDGERHAISRPDIEVLHHNRLVTPH